MRDNTPATLYLPFSTTVYVYGFTNAMNEQKIEITPETGRVIKMIGQSEGNQSTSPPNAVIQTPDSGPNQDGFEVKVAISTLQNGTWVNSDIAGAREELGITAAVCLVVSEDWTDRDYNDAIVMFLWYNPPPIRRALYEKRKREDG